MGLGGRFELKYVLDEPRAAAVAEYVARFLRPSAHNGTGRLRGHPVVSLYLDSPDLQFFHQGDTGQRNRHKLRIRIYDDHWERPASLEIKRRVADVIVKSRAMISREGVRQMLTRGDRLGVYLADYSHLVHGKRRADVFHEFVDLCNLYQVRGILYVSYLREIYQAPDDDELHITLDRQIRGTLYDGTGRLTVPRRGVVPSLPYFPSNGVVLELKFENQFPRWMEQLVRTFDLVQRSVCKYCACVEAMGLQWGRPVLAEQEVAWYHDAGE